MIRKGQKVAILTIKNIMFMISVGLTCAVSGVTLAETLAWVNLNDDEFNDNVRSYTRKGYVPIDFEVIVHSGSRNYALVMDKPRRKKKTILRSQLEESEFKDTWRELLRKGYRPIDVEVYDYENRTLMGAIWIKDRSVSWASYDVMNDGEFDLVTEEARSSNQTPVDINAYIFRKRLAFSAIYADNKENYPWLIERQLPVEEFESHVQVMYQKGYSLIDSNQYIANGKQFYMLAWQEDGKEWKVENGLDEVELSELIELNQQNGYFVKDLEVIKTKNGLRYTALFNEAPVPDASSKGFFKLF